MGNIIVAFSKPQDGRNIRNILVKHGIQVTASCTSGAQVLSLTDDLRSGIVVSGYRFGDMTCRQLADQLPPGFDLLLIASPSRWSGEAMGRIVCLPAPFKMGDLVSTVRMIEQTQAEKRRRMRRQPAAEAQGRGSESDRHRKGYFDGAEPDDGAGGAQISAEMQHGQPGQPY